jgi:hypothetical protein
MVTKYELVNLRQGNTGFHYSILVPFNKFLICFKSKDFKNKKVLQQSLDDSLYPQRFTCVFVCSHVNTHIFSVEDLSSYNKKEDFQNGNSLL